MTILFTNKVFQQHETWMHPEAPRRLETITNRLERTDAVKGCALGEVGTVDAVTLGRVHAESQIAAVRRLAAEGGGRLDPDTCVSDASFDVALKAAGTAAAAVDAVVTGKHRNALCLIRPPGHHATQDRSMGFCLFNNVAVAAVHAQLQHDVGRVLIIDWDVHHGNGTQDIFYDDDRVTFLSIHRWPFYPGTGGSDETGSGAGLGATVNVPVTFGVSREEYLDLFRRGVEKAVAHAKPELILISAGFDAHKLDPLGSLGLETEDFGTMTRFVMDVAADQCQGRIVSCLEGGYNVDALAASVETHLRELSKAPG